MRWFDLQRKDFQSFLIIRLSSLGDILLTTPSIRCLRQAYPKARIDVLIRAQYRGLLEGNPHLSNLILFPDQGDFAALRKTASELRCRYDVVIDLHTGLRSFYLRRRLRADRILRYRKKRLQRWVLVKLKKNIYREEFSVPVAYIRSMAKLGVQDDGKGLEWFAAKERRNSFLALCGLEAAPVPQPIALCPGASHFTKRWPIEKWRELGKRLLDAGEPALWVFGGSEDSEAGEFLFRLHPERVLNFCGKLDLALSGAGISFCRLAITHDAGPAHMAAAVGTPVVDIFGSTVPQFGFSPFRIPHRIAEKKLHCRPCSHLGYSKCPQDHFRCMKDQSVDDILNLAREIAKPA